MARPVDKLMLAYCKATDNDRKWIFDNPNFPAFTFDRSFLQSTIEATRNYNCHLNDLHDLLIVRTFWFREQGKRGATGTPLEKKLYQDLSEGAKVLQAKASVWVGYSEQMCDEAYAKEEHEDGQLPGPMRMMLDMMAGIGIDVSQE